MQFLIQLTDLELLPDAAGVSKLEGDELQVRLRQIFAHLPDGTRFTVTGGTVRVEVPEAGQAEQGTAQRHAETAARKARNGDYSKAKGLLKMALVLDPSLTDARRDLAMICAETGDHEEAKNNLIDVLRMNAGDAWAYVVLANHYFKAEDNKPMAEKLLSRALELKPDDPWALNSLATTVLEQDRPDEALGLYDRAIRSHPEFPNAHFGKALIHVRREQHETAEEALELMFAKCPPEDQRSAGMFEQARKAYLRIETVLADKRKERSGAAIEALLKQAEEQSGYPVEQRTAKLSGSVIAQVRMAWKHRADHHELLLREGEIAEPVRHHMCAHELYHVLMESAGRDAGRNRWFTTTDAGKRMALQSMEREIAAMEKSGIPRNTSARIMEDVFGGAAGLLYNCPLDMRIEKRIRERHPELKQAQFCGIAMLSEDARKATFNQKVRDIMPRTVLRINDALNGAYALFADDLFKGATDYAGPFRKLPAFGLAEELFTLWRELEETVPFGEEWRMVDAFADNLGLRDWYQWQEDRGFLPPEATDTVTREGVTNPDLLREKAAPAVMYLLDALQRYARMSPEEIRQIASEIATIGQEGLDYASPDTKYSLRSLPGKSFSGLQLMCLMYAGFKHFAPHLDAGMDLNEEYLAALELFDDRAENS